MKPQTGTDVHSRHRTLGDALAWLGGAEHEILDIARTGRSRFVQMGLVIVATSAIAVLSMSFALHNGLHLGIGLAVLGGLVWGCVIAVIDRFLIITMNLRGGRGQVATVVGLRLIVAMILGLVISTPLVLQIFKPEIQAQIVTTNATASTSFGEALDATPVTAELERVREEIAVQEDALRGEISPVATPELQARREQLTRVQERLTTLQATSDQKYRAWQCELYGTSCEDSTNVPGNGNLAQAREREYREALAQTDAARDDVADAAAAVEAAVEAASRQSSDAVQQAQAQAGAALPDLRERESQLQAQYNRELDTGSQAHHENNGILAQIVALGELGEQSPEARMAHIAVALLFFMIELLPVLVKLLSSLGAPSAYDRVRELVENSKIEDAKIENRRRTRERDEQEVRDIAEAKKRTDIEDDMRERERTLGVKANTRVASEMEKVLDVALEQWADDVQNTLRATSKPTANGNFVVSPPPPRSAASQPTGRAPDHSSVQGTIRSNFNLPSGTGLASSNGHGP